MHVESKDFVLAVEGLTVSFDGFKAVNDLSFYVDENEIRVIIGPNGAGKTTVLDLICGRLVLINTQMYTLTNCFVYLLSEMRD